MKIQAEEIETKTRSTDLMILEKGKLEPSKRTMYANKLKLM